MTEGAMFADPLRAYVITLRKGQRITQAALAKKIGMGERTYVSWERGTTKSIKDQFARALITAVGGSLEHQSLLDQMSPEEGQQLAREWLATSAEDRQAAQESASKLQRIIALDTSDPQGLEDIIQQIRADARSDPTFLIWLEGYLSGRRGARPPR